MGFARAQPILQIDIPMVALKAAEIDRFLARPDSARPIVLLFGPDAGLVRERAEGMIRLSVDDPHDPFSLVRIEGEDLSGDPSRLVEEANTSADVGEVLITTCHLCTHVNNKVKCNGVTLFW